MIVIMFPALLAACLANICAQSADLLREWAVCLHGFHCKGADICAFTVEPDAWRHHLYMFLIQAGIETMVAGFHAFLASFYAFLIVHLIISFFMGYYLSYLYPGLSEGNGKFKVLSEILAGQMYNWIASLLKAPSLNFHRLRIARFVLIYIVESA